MALSPYQEGGQQRGADGSIQAHRIRIHIEGQSLGLRKGELQAVPPAQTPEIERQLTGEPVHAPFKISQPELSVHHQRTLGLTPLFRDRRIVDPQDPEGIRKITSDVGTIRPSSHTDRAVMLGLEPVRQRHLLPRHLGLHKGEIHKKRASGERTFVKPSARRREVPELSQIAEQLEAVEIPQIIHEVIVVDFSAGVDEAVARQDAFEGVEIPIVVEAPRRDWVKEVMGRARDSGRSFVKDVRTGMDISSQVKVSRSSRAGV